MKGLSRNTRPQVFEVLSLTLIPVKSQTDSNVNISLRIFEYSA